MGGRVHCAVLCNAVLCYVNAVMPFGAMLGCAVPFGAMLICAVPFGGML